MATRASYINLETATQERGWGEKLVISEDSLNRLKFSRKTASSSTIRPSDRQLQRYRYYLLSSHPHSCTEDTSWRWNSARGWKDCKGSHSCGRNPATRNKKCKEQRKISLSHKSHNLPFVVSNTHLEKHFPLQEMALPPMKTSNKPPWCPRSMEINKEIQRTVTKADLE